MKTLGIFFMGVGTTLVLTLMSTFTVSTISAYGNGLLGAGCALVVAGAVNCMAALWAPKS